MKITEKLIQFVWQHQLLNTSNLKTKSDKRVVILNQGVLNTKAGPDFAQAKIVIDNTTLYGSIEIHIDESDWFSHKHHNDSLYNTVILHVCLYQGKSAKLLDGTSVPTIYVGSSLNHQLLEKYQNMMLNQSLIPCSESIHKHYLRTKDDWFEFLINEKLKLRSVWLTSLYTRSAFNWAQTLYIAFLRVLGAHTNATAFEELAIKLPLKLLIKHQENKGQLDALLLGVAACIPLCQDAKHMKAEFKYLQELYGLEPISTIIKASGVRPNANPIKRLKMLSGMIHYNAELINQMSSVSSIVELKQLMIYLKEDKIQSASDQLVQLVLINAIIPFQYFKNKSTASSNDSSLDFLRFIKAERNQILAKWETIKISPINSFESQAILHLYKTYCIFKRCLDCQFGIECLKNID